MRWLLIRGLSRDARHWGPFPPTFAEGLGVEVQTIDPPGFGTQVTRTSPSSIAEITNDIRDRANIQGDDWSILGISLGGMVTLDWVARYPNEFQRAVVINTSASASPSDSNALYSGCPRIGRRTNWTSWASSGRSGSMRPRHRERVCSDS
jgi:pimeloyl-ACP methyl ester carboxylesterase